MNLERYLLTAVAALKNDVLPTLPPSPARDQVVNCLRVLTRAAIGMEAVATGCELMVDDATLPQSIRDAFAAGLTAQAIPSLAEEIAVDRSTLAGMQSASQWLSSQPWCDDAALATTARSLLAWERRQRDTRLARMAAAEQSDAAAPTATFSGAKLNETSLLEYLRRQLNNPTLELEGYRSLPGGRTRKTIMFKQTGQADWPEWLVVQCDPPVGYHAFPGVVSQFPVLEYVHRDGRIRSPQPLLIELDPAHFGTPFMIVERMPGSPPSAGINFFAPPPPSEALALDLARQIGMLHSLSVAPVPKEVPVMLPGAAGWAGDLEALIAKIGSVFHGPSLTISAAFAWMRKNVQHVANTVTLVHGDFLQHNLLTDGDRVTGILDWEGVRIGHPGEDLGYMRPMIEQMTSWDRFMEVYFASGGPQFSQAEADYFTLRAYILMLTHIAHSRNEFEAGRVDDIRAAEVGCSLSPLFINCVAATLDKILEREAAEVR
ncbi:MAG: phosphotransferase [Duganella sp.]